MHSCSAANDGELSQQSRRDDVPNLTVSGLLLHHAAATDHTTTVSYLLEHGADAESHTSVTVEMPSPLSSFLPKPKHRASKETTPVVQDYPLDINAPTVDTTELEKQELPELDNKGLPDASIECIPRLEVSSPM